MVPASNRSNDPTSPTVGAGLAGNFCYEDKLYTKPARLTDNAQIDLIDSSELMLHARMFAGGAEQVLYDS